LEVAKPKPAEKSKQQEQSVPGGAALNSAIFAIARAARKQRPGGLERVKKRHRRFVGYRIEAD
jgi:hypothetical protein